eukprot:UN01054
MDCVIQKIKQKKRNSNHKINSLQNIEFTISNNDTIKLNDTQKIWEFYWSSDGQHNTHRAFSCFEMFQRHHYYFKNATESVMFKRIDENKWFCNWSDNLINELKRCNNEIQMNKK